jgi:hypothetical protein
LVRHREQHRVGRLHRLVRRELLGDAVGLNRVRPAEARPDPLEQPDLVFLFLSVSDRVNVIR